MSLNKTILESELFPQTMLEHRHLAMIGFVVVTGEVEHAMKNEDLQFLREVVMEAAGVGGGDGGADDDVAGEVARDLGQGGKAEDVGGGVFAAELAVQGLHAAARDDEDVDVAADTGGTARARDEALQRGFGDAVQFGFDGDQACRPYGTRTPHSRDFPRRHVPGYELARFALKPTGGLPLQSPRKG